jgi:lipopolysaccharide biosynthesis regulator YciM
MPVKKKAHDPAKARKHALKGDSLFKKGKLEKALEEYRRAYELDPETTGILDKLQAAHDRAGGEWHMEDFAESVSWTMEKQARENPLVRQVHAKLTPEYAKATELAISILTKKSPEECGGEIEKLIGMGEVATRALIGMIFELKRAALERESAGGKADEDAGGTGR